MLAWPAFEVGVQKVDNQHESLTFSAVLHSMLERVCMPAGENRRRGQHHTLAKHLRADSMRQLDMDTARDNQVGHYFLASATESAHRRKSQDRPPSSYGSLLLR